MPRFERWKKWLFVIIVLGAVLALFDRYRTWRENSQDKVILEASARYGVHAALVKAVVWRESGFYPRARGAKGEYGLMQVMPDTAREWARAERVPLHFDAELLDPGMNTRAGTWYLRRVSRRYQQADNPLPYALADYNAGRGNVLRWAQGAAATNSALFIQQIGFPSTRDYVRSVMSRYERYRRSFPPARS
jgi:soluble lytic murein transglycosylase